MFNKYLITIELAAFAEFITCASVNLLIISLGVERSGTFYWSTKKFEPM